ncbi:Lipoyl synthase [Trichinella pseudospiralis]
MGTSGLYVFSCGPIQWRSLAFTNKRCLPRSDNASLRSGPPDSDSGHQIATIRILRAMGPQYSCPDCSLCTLA